MTTMLDGNNVVGSSTFPPHRYQGNFKNYVLDKAIRTALIIINVVPSILTYI